MDETEDQETLRVELGEGGTDGLPKAYLRVLAQQGLELTDYAIFEGETTIGRSEECSIFIEGYSLSRQHAVILVEDGGHFVLDHNSRNKTTRGTVKIRPNTYYELTDGCEVTFADIKCQYFLGPPPAEDGGGTEDVGAEGGTCEATQAYHFAEGEGEGEADQLDGEGEGSGAYFPSEGEEEGERGMECEPTVAYNLGAGDVEEDEESSVASPPLLTANTGDSHVTDARGHSAPDKTIDNAADDDDDDDETDVEEAGKEEAETVPNGAGGHIDPTVLYEMDTDTETDDEGEGSKVIPSPADQKGAEQRVTSDQAGHTTGEKTKSGTSGNGGGAKEGEFSDPTLPYESPLVENDSPPVDSGPPPVKSSPPAAVPPSAESAPPADEKAPSPMESGPPTVENGSPPVEDDGEGMQVDSTRACDADTQMVATDTTDSDSDFVDTFLSTRKTATSSRAKQKTLLRQVSESQAQERGRGRGGRGRGRGGRRGAKSRAAALLDVEEESDQESPLVANGSSKQESRKEASSAEEKPAKANTRTASVRATTRSRKQSKNADVSTPGDTPPPPPQTDLTPSEAGSVGSETVAPSDSTVAGKSRGGGRRGKSARARGKRGGRTTQRSAAPPTGEGEQEKDDLLLRESPDVDRSAKTGSDDGGVSSGSHDQSAKTGSDGGVSSGSHDQSTKTGSDSGSHDQSHEQVASGESHDQSCEKPGQGTQATEPDTPPAAPAAAKKGRGGRRGKGTRGRGAGRVKASQSQQSVHDDHTSSPTRLQRRHTTPISSSPATSSTSHTPSCAGPSEDTHRVMFTGLIDKKGERTVKELGGELVDSVYDCTHLVTDKVRRTVKFLCCLSRGCMIVSDSWLDACGKAGQFLPAKAYLVKDKSAERQHMFALAKSHERAQHQKLLSGYQVHLTPSLRPERQQMADIVKCSGGEPLNFDPQVSPGDKVLVVSCEEDLSMCRECYEAGVPVHSTELILGGVLKQQLDLKSHLMTLPSAPATGRKRKAREQVETTSTSKRRRK